MLYMVTFTIHIPPMLAYIAYMDPMGDGMRREHTFEDGSSRKLRGSAGHRTPHRGSQNPSRGSMAEALAEENDREWELTGIVRGF